MSRTRRDSLGLIGAALLLPSCALKTSNAVRVGSKSSGENQTIAEVYALALERAQIPVQRRMNLGDSSAAMDALFRGDIDLYPEYDTLRGSDGRRGVAWLASAPMDASPCLATSQYAAEAYWLLTLETCAAIAPKLRLAAGADFLAAAGGLQRLQRAYGRFRFKRVLRVEAGRQYDLLSRGDADVAAAYTTDARMAEKQLIILGDTKHVWPRGTLAPVIRTGSLRAHPQAGSILNRVSKTVTTYAVQQMNMRRELLYMTPRDVAEGFLDAHRALTLR